MQQQLQIKQLLLRLTLISTLGFLFLASQTAHAHCQVPCGIYDDHARVKTMLEDAATVSKAVDLINDLSGKTDPQSNNQLVRWVVNKEKHADNIISIISNYFLTQRVNSNQKDYQVRLARHHAVIVSAMKVKQNVDSKLVDTLIQDINALLVYYPEHSHKDAKHKK